MGPGLADRERHDVARRQIAPALGRADRRLPGEHDQHLLLAALPVVRAHRLPGRQAVDARAEPLSARPCTHAITGGAEALRVLVVALQLGPEHVRHGLASWLKMPTRDQI